MSWDLRKVGPDFLDSAPLRHTTAATVHHEPGRVFAAIASDPAGWGTWFPGFSPRGRYLTGAPQGPGSVRRMWLGGIRFDETILTWEDPTTWEFRADSTSLPVAYALAERYLLEESAAGCRVEWTFAFDPRPPARRAARAVGPVLDRMFARAMSNLDGRLAR